MTTSRCKPKLTFKVSSFLLCSACIRLKPYPSAFLDENSLALNLLPLAKKNTTLNSSIFSEKNADAVLKWGKAVVATHICLGLALLVMD